MDHKLPAAQQQPQESELGRIQAASNQVGEQLQGRMKRIVVLISGSGTNLQALIDATTQQGRGKSDSSGQQTTSATGSTTPETSINSASKEKSKGEKEAQSGAPSDSGAGRSSSPIAIEARPAQDDRIHDHDVAALEVQPSGQGQGQGSSSGSGSSARRASIRVVSEERPTTVPVPVPVGRDHSEPKPQEGNLEAPRVSSSLGEGLAPHQYQSEVNSEPEQGEEGGQSRPRDSDKNRDNVQHGGHDQLQLQDPDHTRLGLLDRLRTESQIVLVLSNRKAAFGLTRAQNADPPIRTAYLGLQPFLKGRVPVSTAPAAEGEGETRPKTRDDYDRRLARIVLDAQPDLVVLAGWMHVLGDGFFDVFHSNSSSSQTHSTPKAKIINLHPALPGTFDGSPNAIHQAFLSFQQGEITKTGVMVHEVIPAVDKGKPVIVREIPMIKGESEEELEGRVHKVEWEVLVEAAARVLFGHGDASGDGEGEGGGDV